MSTISRETAAKLLIARSYASTGAAAAEIRHQAETVAPGQTIHLPGKDLTVAR